MVSIEVTGLGV